MKITYAISIAGIAITIIFIISTCVANLQILYGILQRQVSTGCIGATLLGDMYSFTGNSILTWTLISCAFMILELLLFLAVRGASMRREKFAAIRLSGITVVFGSATFFSTYMIYNTILNIYQRCGIDAIYTMSIVNIVCGLILLILPIICTCLSVVEERRYYYKMPRRLERK